MNKPLSKLFNSGNSAGVKKSWEARKSQAEDHESGYHRMSMQAIPAFGDTVERNKDLAQKAKMVADSHKSALESAPIGGRAGHANQVKKWNEISSHHANLANLLSGD